MNSKMEDRTCKTCRHNDDLLCDKKGIWIRDDYSCSKWETQPWQQWRKSIMSKFLERGENMDEIKNWLKVAELSRKFAEKLVQVSKQLHVEKEKYEQSKRET